MNTGIGNNVLFLPANWNLDYKNKDGKSVLTLGQQEIYLKNSLKASEIYKNINEKKDTLGASDREHQLFLEVLEKMEILEAQKAAQKEKGIKK